MAGANITCPEHPRTLLVEDHHAGDMICPDCGRVVGDRIVDVGSEWRTFSDSNNDPSRVGAAENPLLDNDLTTRIGVSTGSTEYQARSSLTSAQRTMQAALRDIKEMAERAGLPATISDESASYFKKVHDERKLRNRPRLAVVAACVYFACRQNGASRSFRELSALSGVQTSVIARACNAIMKATDVKVAQGSPIDFISRHCSSLKLPMSVERIATHIVTIVSDKSILDGRQPASVVSAAIYMAMQIAGEKRDLKEISQVCGSSETTIKQSYRILLTRAADVVPKEHHSKIRKLNVY